MNDLYEKNCVTFCEKEKLISTEQLNVMKSKKVAFDWINLGETNLKIGKLLDFILQNEYLLPPRTGHLGNWERIIKGQASMMDFNNIITKKKYGSPLIYPFTLTENEDLTGGDNVYLPGSVFINDKRIKLDIYTWNRLTKDFTKRERVHSYFTPFVQTKINGELVPLVDVHFKKLKDEYSIDFELESSLIFHNESKVRKIIHFLLQYVESNTSNNILPYLFSHEVYLDGTMTRTKVQYDGENYILGDIIYKNSEELINACMMPFYAVENSVNFFAEIENHPNCFPLISNTLMGIISAQLNSHIASVNRNKFSNKDINFHFHWGARDMGGYPPLKKGYFSSKSHRKGYKRVLEILVNSEKGISPTYFVIIPAVIFSLCPSSHYPKDIVMLKDLFKEILSINTLEPLSDEEMMKCINNKVDSWLVRNQKEISAYFLNKFNFKSGILHDNYITSDSSTIEEPDNFRELTFKQACMIVGSLHELINKSKE